MRGSPFAFSNFSMGLNALDSPYELKTGEARDVLNMQSTLRGAIRKRNGSIQFAGGIVPPFSTLPIVDTFERANEKPLSNGGKWAAAGGVGRGEVFSNHWQPGETRGAAYWTVGEQASPAVSIQISQCSRISYAPITLSVAKLTGDPQALTNTSYTAEYDPNSTRDAVTLSIKSAAKSGVGVGTTKFRIANGGSLGLAVREGAISVWGKASATTPWVKLIEHSDKKLTKGWLSFSAQQILEEEGEVGEEVFLKNFASGEAAAAVELAKCTSIGQANFAGSRYLLVTAGKNLYSINTAGEISIIKEGLTENTKWCMFQATKGAPNRVVASGPVYLSNGVDPPLYWTGVAKNTEAVTWTSKPEGEFLETPKAKYLLYHEQRVWAAGIEGSDSAVRFSGLSEKEHEGFQVDPTNWPKPNLMWFEQSDGYAITGLGTSGRYILVFKPHALWAIFATATEEGEGVRQVSENVGCVSHRSIVETEGGTYFLTPDKGVFVTNGLSIREISQQVRPILQGTDYRPSRAADVSQLESAAAGFLNGHYYLSYTAQDESRKTLDYDVLLKSWWLHDLAGEQWIVWGTTTNESSLFTIPAEAKKGVYKAFVPGIYTDGGGTYAGGRGQGRSVPECELTEGSTEVLAPWAEWMTELVGQALSGAGVAPGSVVVSVTKVKSGLAFKAKIVLSLPATANEASVTLTPGNLSCYWISSWEPFWQYFMRHRFQQPQVKKRVHQLFVDGRGELSSFLFTTFGKAYTTLAGTVDNADMAKPESVLTLSDDTEEPEPEYKAARYYSLGAHRVFSVMFGNASAHRLEVTAYAMDISFRKS